jgi:Holliday junction resolvasome RuvABC endonuclease subunit
MPKPKPDAWRIIGVDPGFALTGMSVLENDAKLGVVACELMLVSSPKLPKKEVTELRVSADDSRRLRIIFDALAALTGKWEPRAIAVEAYAPFTGRGGGNAWKCAMSFALVQAFAFSKNLPCFVFLPSDLKRTFGLNRSASKGEIGHALTEKVIGLAGHIEKVTPSKQEHVTDATGHAYLGLSHMQHMREMAGLA